MTSYIYKCREAAVGHIAEMYDMNGNKLAEAVGIGKKDAMRQARIKSGVDSVVVLDSLPTEFKKSRKKKNSRNKKMRRDPSKGSIMTGLSGVTSSRNWKHTK